MGHVYSTYVTSPDTSPDFRNYATFDPLEGFENGRKERVPVATEAEMEAAGLPAHQRDYCAHHLIDFLKCRKEKFPWVAGCKDQKMVWDHCQHDDYILRMKEYERERRLLERKKRRSKYECSDDNE